ncbi:hypothetical protein ACI48D_17155 [Massilia sp. LXY-6]
MPIFAGTLPSAQVALPAAFEVHTRAPARHLLGDIEDNVGFLGYRIQTIEQPGRAWRYRLNHPEWMRWRENEITVRLQDDRRIAIHDPRGALGMLRKNLARREGFASLPR